MKEVRIEAFSKDEKTVVFRTSSMFPTKYAFRTPIRASHLRLVPVFKERQRPVYMRVQVFGNQAPDGEQLLWLV